MSSHPVTRSIKEQLKAMSPAAQVSHAQILMLVEVLRELVKPDNPSTAEATQASRKILTRVWERVSRELRQYLPPPVGFALLLNMAAGILSAMPKELHPAAQRLAAHLLAAPGSYKRLPTQQVAELCRLLAGGEAPPKA